MSIEIFQNLGLRSLAIFVQCLSYIIWQTFLRLISSLKLRMQTSSYSSTIRRHNMVKGSQTCLNFDSYFVGFSVTSHRYGAEIAACLQVQLEVANFCEKNCIIVRQHLHQKSYM